MPFALLRYTPITGHLGEAWLERVKQVDDAAVMGEELKERTLAKPYLPRYVSVEQCYRYVTESMAKEILVIANGMRTLHDVCHLVLIKAEGQWRTKDEGRVVQRGGRSFAGQIAKRVDFVGDHIDIERWSVRGHVATVPCAQIHAAVEFYEDEEDWMIVNLISDPDLSLEQLSGQEIPSTKLSEEAFTYAELLAEQVQGDVDQKIDFDEAVGRSRIRDKTFFSRSLLR